MAKVREEIVGKRFLSVSKSCKLKLSKISEWDWRAGVIRACTHADSKHPELQILVEYEDVSWQRREWIHVHKEQAFQILLVEHTLVWAPWNGGAKLRGASGFSPALSFEALVDEVGLSQTKDRPLEYLADRSLEFHDYSLVRNYQDGECLRLGDEESQEAVRRWVAEQDGQRILCTTPSVLVGFRVQVYRSEGTTQWYTAVIVGYNDATRELTVTDDTVLEEHSEDPSLVHIRLLGEGVVESILRGENVGITPRRSRSSSNNHHQTGVRHNRREQITTSRGRKQTLSSRILPPSISSPLGLSPPSPVGSTSPTSLHLPPLNPLKPLTLHTRSDDQPTVDEGLNSSVPNPADFGSCSSSLSQLVKDVSSASVLQELGPSEEKRKSSSPSLDSGKNPPLPHIETSPPKHIHSNPNLSNSPNSPTNPDKPTNPRQKGSSTSSEEVATPSLSSCDNLSEEGTYQSISLAVAHPSPSSASFSSSSSQQRKDPDSSSTSQGSKAPQAPHTESEKDTRCALEPAGEDKKEGTRATSVDSTCTVDSNSSLKKVFIKLRNNVQLKPLPDEEQQLLVENRNVKECLVKKEEKLPSLKSASAVPSPETNSVTTSAEANNEKTTSAHVEKDKDDLVEPTNSDGDLCKQKKVDSIANPVTDLVSYPVIDDCNQQRPSSETIDPPRSGESSSENLCTDDRPGHQEKNSSPISPAQRDKLPDPAGDLSIEESADQNRVVNDRGLNTSEEPCSVEKDDGASLDALGLLRNHIDSVSSAQPTNPIQAVHQSSVVLSPNSDVKRRNSVELSNGRVRHFPLLIGGSSNKPPSFSLDAPAIPDLLKSTASSSTPRQVIVLSSVDGCLKVEEDLSLATESRVPPDRASLVPLPSIGLGKSASEVLSRPASPDQLLKNNAEVASRLLHPDCTLSVSRVGDPSLSGGDAGRHPPPVSDCVSIVSVTSTPVSSCSENTEEGSTFSRATGPPALNGSGALAQSLAAAGAVSGRAVTITATSGPAPQGTSRVASPPSVSITAVVRGSPTYHPPSHPSHHHQQHPSDLSAAPPHHDGAAASLHPQPQQQPFFGPLATAPRMDQGDGSSDSGVSVTERSVSRSSVLSDDRSSSAEVKPNTPTPAPAPLTLPKNSVPPLVVDRKEAVKVWRNPAVLSQSELSVRHIHSLQHTMSQHFPGVPPHIAAPGGAQTVAHAASHPAAHGAPPPPASSLSHAIPPPLHYPGHHGPPPPLHLTPSLQPSISAAAALYAQQDVWKQLGHVGPLGAPHHYASLLPRHQDEFYLEHHAAREIEKQHQADRIQRERREVEAREKQAKEKMERERADRQRKERERKDRDERERAARRADWPAERANENELQLVNKHFEESFRFASQKHGRENLRHLPSETHPASVFYAQGLTNHQTTHTHLTHNQSLLISQQQQQQQQQQHHQQQQQQHHQQHHHHQQQPQPPQSQYHQPPQQHNQNKAYQPQSQKGSQWSLPLKVDARDHRQTSRHQPHVQPGEGMRKVKEPEQFVQESIFKAFRADDPVSDAHMKSHNPPPAHSKSSSSDKASSLSGYPPHLGIKDPKPHSIERIPYQLSHEKTSVIVQPDMKFDKVAQLSGSPKRLPERSSPYLSNPSGPNHYKPYEPSPPQRGSTPHHPSSLSPSPHTVELTKARQPSSSPHTAPTVAHTERYYSSGTKPPVSSPYQPSIISGSLVQNPMHNVTALPTKPKVSSPPPQMYGKPGITAGVPVCKIDTRPVQHPSPLTSKVSPMNEGPPPPAHSGIRNHESRLPPPTPHEQRVSHNRSPFDARHYSPKAVVTSALSTTHPTSRVPTTSPHVTGHPPLQPTQTQPLDLGTRDGGTSPTNRRRSQTPTPQEAKRPRLENINITSSPLLSRVSEPSPLYPTAATTITTVENTVALASLQRVSPLTNSPQNTSPSNIGGKSSSVIANNSSAPHLQSSSSSCNPTPNPINSNPTLNLNLNVSSNALATPAPNPTPTITSTPSMLSESGSTPTSVANVTPRPASQPPASSNSNSARTESDGSPGSSKITEPEKSTSPVPPVGGYVHKLKKAWLQRHKSGAETPPLSAISTPRGGSTPTSPSNSNVTTKPSTSLSSSTVKQQEVKAPVRKPKPSAGMPNGHGQEPKDIDSSSSDSEDSNSSKMKRGKTKRSLKRTKKSSESNSDSDKESDGSEGSVKKQENMSMKQDTEPRRRRGRKPKIKPEKEESIKPKKPKDDPPNDPLQKPPVSQLKKTGESFLQDRSCYEVAPKLPKCRECRWTPHQRNKKMPNIFCRFYAFRRLRYTKNGQLAVAGFSDPVKDAFGEDLHLWVPDPSAPAPDLDCEMSKFLITHVGDQFCDLVQQEKEAMALHVGEDSVIAWKRVVTGVREMCDVCETTLFNVHWACSKCGFVVCIDCYKGRKEGTIKVWDCEEGAKERDKFSWLLCASRLPHEQDKLMLTQIIAGNALIELGKKIHEIRYKWAIPMYCGCPEANKYKEKEQEDKKLNGISKDLMKNIKKESKCDLVNGAIKMEKGERINSKDDDVSNSPLNFFADVALSNDKRESETSNSDSDSDSDDKETQPSTLRELLTVRPSSKSSASGKEDSTNSSSIKNKEPSKKKAKLDTLDDVISCVIERDVDKDSKKDPMKVELKHFVRKYNYNRKGREPLPIRIMTKTESRLLYPNVSHSWLCDGKLLHLHDPHHEDNVSVFQDQWKRGQPVIVSGAGQRLNPDLWKPQSFSRDFGEVKNNLINCLTENIVPNQPMKKFWDGFEHYGKRLKDEKGQPMVLKLKDWPPTDDFAELLPCRFDDLMKGLPMGQYTRRNGSLNLAGRLPDGFVRPDLGPKMYIAYGSASYPNKASTNLHLDISDAVNVMCYVGVPKDVEPEENKRETLKAISEAGCDILTRQRVREKDEIPGALWHIYHARDADKIRDLLNKVAIERGKKLEPYHDPIHDQSWYLDGPLRERLYKEYAVEGYAIVQCMGDAVFIPAGAPHQVRNLQNCVKVAEDFVSPENVSHCFHLTQEFRHLSDTHTNHEDKLQIKNIIYHAMKDSIAALMATQKNMESAKIKKEDDDS